LRTLLVIACLVSLTFLIAKVYGDVEIDYSNDICDDYPCYADFDIIITTSKERVFDNDIPLNNLDNTLYKGDSYRYISNITITLYSVDGYYPSISDIDMITEGFSVIDNGSYLGLIYDGIIKTPNNIGYGTYNIKAEITFSIPYRYEHTHTSCYTDEDGNTHCYSYTHIHTDYTSRTETITLDTFEVVEHEPEIRILEWLALIRGNESNSFNFAFGKQFNIALHYLNNNPERRVIIDNFDYKLFAYNYTDSFNYYNNTAEAIEYSIDPIFIAEDIYLNNTCYNSTNMTKIVIDKVGYCNIIVDYEPLTFDKMQDKVFLTLNVNATAYEWLENNKLFNASFIYPDTLLSIEQRLYFADNVIRVTTVEPKNDTLPLFLNKLYNTIIEEHYNTKDEQLALIPIQLDHNYVEKVSIDGKKKFIRPTDLQEEIFFSDTPYSINQYYNNMTKGKYFDYALCVWVALDKKCKELSYPLVAEESNIALISSNYDPSEIISVEGKILKVNPFYKVDNRTYTMVGSQYYLNGKEYNCCIMRLDEGINHFDIKSVFNGYGSKEIIIEEITNSVEIRVADTIYIALLTAFAILAMPKILSLFGKMLNPE
jgi:hypothetical protein